MPAVTIASATFEAYLEEVDQPDPRTVDLLRVSLSPWDEYTVNWNTQPSAEGTGISIAVGGVTGHYYQWDVTDLVQSWRQDQLKRTAIAGILLAHAALAAAWIGGWGIVLYLISLVAWYLVHIVVFTMARISIPRVR